MMKFYKTVFLKTSLFFVLLLSATGLFSQTSGGGECYTFTGYKSTANGGVMNYNANYTSGSYTNNTLGCADYTGFTMNYSATFSGGGSLTVANPGDKYEAHN